MVNNLDKDAPACDMFIGLLAKLESKDVTLYSGQWQVRRFSQVINGYSVNALGWKINMSDEMVGKIREHIFNTLLSSN